jgi:hypothetical protein
MAKYYRVLIEYREIYDVVTKADSEDEATAYAVEMHGELDHPISQEVKVYEISELEVKK